MQYTGQSPPHAVYTVVTFGALYADVIERLQHYFVKRALGIKRTVPNYLLRLESGLPPLKMHMIKQVLKFWIKILNMD